MDANKFRSKNRFLKAGDHELGYVIKGARAVLIEEDRWDNGDPRMTFTLATGEVFTCTSLNVDRFIDAWGSNTDDWLDRSFDLERTELPIKDKLQPVWRVIGLERTSEDEMRIEEQRLKARAEAKAKAAKADKAATRIYDGNGEVLPAANGSGGRYSTELGDDIPFAPEWR